MGDELLAFDIGRLVRNPDFRAIAIEDGILAAPEYSRFADAGKHVIRTIHALPNLWEKCTLGEVELYIGRTAATANHVFGRWKSHAGDKSHRHALVVLRCHRDVVDVWETAAVRTLQRLHTHGRLCVKNASASGQGSLPAERECCIYITWKLTKRSAIEPADRSLLDDIADHVAEKTEELRPSISAQHVRRAIDPLTRPVHERGYVVWHPEHDDEN